MRHRFRIRPNEIFIDNHTIYKDYEVFCIAILEDRVVIALSVPVEDRAYLENISAYSYEGELLWRIQDQREVFDWPEDWYAPIDGIYEVEEDIIVGNMLGNSFRVDMYTGEIKECGAMPAKSQITTERFSTREGGRGGHIFTIRPKEISIDNHVIHTDYEVISISTLEDRVIILLRVPVEDRAYLQNVFAYSYEGELLWRIQDQREVFDWPEDWYAPMDSISKAEGDYIRAYNMLGNNFRVDIHTGEIKERWFTP